jgi:ATP/maltotriose-dependent transcriptional regulator MalT
MQLESAEQALTELPHLVHLFSKLGVTDRTAAVTVAVERGLIRLGQ